MDINFIPCGQRLRWQDYRITNVGTPGGDAFLLQNQKGAFLCDSGFGYSSPILLRQIEEELRVPLTHILLTHSHYDHVLGSAACTQKWPYLCVIASGYAKKIMEKPSARAFMENMDQNAAQEAGSTPIAGFAQKLRVDLPVEDGDWISLPGARLQALSLPGHTRCSFGFWDQDHSFLLSSESVGMAVGDGKIMPTYLVSYRETIRTIEKILSLSPRAVLLPHTGLVTGGNVQAFMKMALYWTERTRDMILSSHSNGSSVDEIIGQLKAFFYNDSLRQIDPEKAFRVNATHTIAATLREYVE